MYITVCVEHIMAIIVCNQVLMGKHTIGTLGWDWPLPYGIPNAAAVLKLQPCASQPGLFETEGFDIVCG